MKIVFFNSTKIPHKKKEKYSGELEVVRDIFHNFLFSSDLNDRNIKVL